MIIEQQLKSNFFKGFIKTYLILNLYIINKYQRSLLKNNKLLIRDNQREKKTCFYVLS